MMMFINSKTNRGFGYFEFLDRYGVKCSIQHSSLATEDAIWFGADDPNPRILAEASGTTSDVPGQKVGWVKYPLPNEVLLNTRMHLTRDQVRELLPILQRFVETGKLREDE